MYRLVINTKTDKGIYTDIKPTDKRNTDGHRLYTARCKVCGTIVTRRLVDLKRDNSVCVHKYTLTNIQNKRILKIFGGMKQRCYNKFDVSYNMYGAKGIKICNEWLNDPSKFERWSLENGYAENLTIDRKDPSKDYCPENCRWVTSTINSKYKSTTKLLFVDDIGLSLRDWSAYLGRSNHFMSDYLKTHNEKEAIRMIKKCIDKSGINGLIRLKEFSNYFINRREYYYVIDIKIPGVKKKNYLTIDKILAIDKYKK